MQCPNCRKVEKGQWLYANGCRSIPEFSVDDWVHEEEVYDIGGYSEMVNKLVTLSVPKFCLLVYITLDFSSSHAEFLLPKDICMSKTLVFMYLCSLLEFTGAHLEVQHVFLLSSK